MQSVNAPGFMTGIFNMNTDSSRNSKTAIVSITKTGAALGKNLKQLLLDSDVFLLEKFVGIESPGEYTYKDTVRDIVTEVFHRYQYLVLIMAVGAAVRLLAGEIKDKYIVYNRFRDTISFSSKKESNGQNVSIPILEIERTNIFEKYPPK